MDQNETVDYGFNPSQETAAAGAEIVKGNLRSPIGGKQKFTVSGNFRPQYMPSHSSINNNFYADPEH